jgi:hypothetical protein
MVHCISSLLTIPFLGSSESKWLVSYYAVSLLMETLGFSESECYYALLSFKDTNDTCPWLARM